MKKSTLLLDACLIAFSGFGMYATSQLKSISSSGLSNKLYPMFVFAVLGLLGIAITVRGLLSAKEKEVVIHFRKVLPTIIAVSAYGLLLKYVNFCALTLIFLPLFMLLFGERRIKHIVAISVFGTAGLYLMFVVGLSLPL